MDREEQQEMNGIPKPEDEKQQGTKLFLNM